MSTIKHWPTQDRPREKLLAHGAATLTDTELLAIFLRTGTRGKSAIDLARDLLSHFGGVRQLLNSKAAQFCALKGLGNAKYAQLQAATEIAKRAIQQQLNAGDALTNPKHAVEYLQHRLQNQREETLLAIFLDNQNRVLAIETLAQGSIDQANMHPRQLVQQVLSHHAKSIILAHNHPSGDPTPSQQDRELTDHIRKLLNMIDVQLLDHLIIGHGQYYAFSQHHITLV